MPKSLPTIVSVEDVAGGVAQKAVTLVEVLPPTYFSRGHLPGAKNLPLDGFEAAATTALPDKSARIVVYCTGPTCKSSDAAGKRLAELGYTDVGVFVGGKTAWVDSGRALEVL